MILYFSGIGNTEYLAETLAHQLNDEVVNLFDTIKMVSREIFTQIGPMY